jgi:hypothetical protein
MQACTMMVYAGTAGRLTRGFEPRELEPDHKPPRSAMIPGGNYNLSQQELLLLLLQ